MYNGEWRYNGDASFFLPMKNLFDLFQTLTKLLKTSERVFNKKMVIASQGLAIKKIEKIFEQIFEPFFSRKESYNFFKTSPASIS